jgi:hypothetical protein
MSEDTETEAQTSARIIGEYHHQKNDIIQITLVKIDMIKRKFKQQLYDLKLSTMSRARSEEAKQTILESIKSTQSDDKIVAICETLAVLDERTSK